MCLFFAIVSLMGPRAAIVIWWVIDAARFRATFDMMIWPILGTIFLPWTTMAYMIVYPHVFEGLNWIWLAVGLILDLSSFGGSGWGARKR